jgi:putative spermidine/putrescine transport system ATP-binding protein
LAEVPDRLVTAPAGVEIRLERLSKSYGGVKAADDVSLVVPGGSFVTLLGPSGSGKTTTLMIVAGFVQPDAGEVFIGGRRVSHVPAYRRAIGMVFQHYALFPHMTVFDNIAYPLRMRRLARNVIAERVGATLALIQLPDVAQRYPHQLSGGQQQRIALARAVVFEPQILLMDEPLGALDRKLREQMQVELREFQRTLGVTTLSVTHDQEEAMALSDLVVIMRDGRLEQAGPPSDLYERPSSRFVAEFLGTSNAIEGVLQRGAGGGLELLTGSGLCLPIGEIGARPPGAAAQLLVRPERIRWAEDEPTEVRADGVVAAVTFLGERLRYQIRLEGGPVITVSRPNLRNIRVVGLGSAIQVGWNRDDAVLL